MTLKRLHDRSLNVARGAEGAGLVPLLEGGQPEEAEGGVGVPELGPRASASGVSLVAVVARVRKDRRCARLAKRHPHLAEHHPARGHDPLLEEEYLRRRQDCNLSHAVYEHIDLLLRA